MEIYKSVLNLTQKENLKRLYEYYGDGKLRTTEGNVSLLNRILDEDDFEILQWIYDEVTFYSDINPLLVGEIVYIIMRSKLT